MNLSSELTKQVKAHLDEVRKYLGTLPADERQEILQSIESHIYDALETRSDGEPTQELLSAVLAEMDPPESYGERAPIKKFGSGVKLLLVVLTLLLGVWIAYKISPENPPAHISSVDAKQPPVVVSTSPADGDNAVDPDITKLRVTFNKDMLTDRMWSWCTESPDTAPKFVSSGTRFIDKRTCVVPVELEPNKTYVIWINTQKHDSFRDTNHQPAKPYRLELRTGNVLSPNPIGHWQSVDFVSSSEEFHPQTKSWSEALELKELSFLPDGKTDRPYWTWEDGILHHSGDNTDAKFFIKSITEEIYLFLEWMSGDVINKGLPPGYYVLKKTKPGTDRSEQVQPVPFELGLNTLSEKDAIVIEQVSASSSSFAVGDTVTVEGKYTLTSQPEATLLLTATATTGDGHSRTTDRQHILVSRGSGGFLLTYKIPHSGCSHLAFYSTVTGQSIGGLHFGTENQLKALINRQTTYKRKRYEKIIGMHDPHGLYDNTHFRTRRFSEF